ncbi:unnamed protein product [Caenorhabditis brenneri]
MDWLAVEEHAMRTAFQETIKSQTRLAEIHKPQCIDLVLHLATRKMPSCQWNEKSCMLAGWMVDNGAIHNGGKMTVEETSRSSDG